MFKSGMTVFIIIMLFMVFNLGAAADDADTPQDTHRVQVAADDGLMLHGHYYTPFEGESPAVLLIHQLYTTSASWEPLIQPLIDAGYRVLSIDLRGYGLTRGRINWRMAQQDTQIWLNWLYEQPGVGPVFVMGSSMGANLALVACADAPRCRGSIALSPGLNYFGVRTMDALLSGTPALVIYAERDAQPARDVPQMLTLTAELNTVTPQAYPGRIHGMALFSTYNELFGLILEWMNARR